jgi:hypothetical protein
MADYSNAQAVFITATTPAAMEDAVETYILSIDSTTFPVISIVPWRDGVLVISAS